MNQNKLSVHSYESFGTVDGPGIRFVVFLNGCPLRCAYCHNPDTWTYKSDKLVGIDEIKKQILMYKSFTKGSVTFSGGEPLTQAHNLIPLFEELKLEGIHICLDTSGSVPLTEDVKRLIELTDIVLVDIKHMNNEKAINLIGQSNSYNLEFCDYLKKINKETWLRYVLLRGYTDGIEELKSLGKYLKTLTNVSKFEILPYHTYGINKYKQLEIDYKLIDVKATTEEEVEIAKEIILNA